MTPAWYTKLTPLALRSLSSSGAIPSMMEGVLRTSSGVKDHWFATCSGVCDPDGGAGVCWPDAAWDRGGELRDDGCGGVGAAGGTSRRCVGDRDGLSWRGGFVTVGG